MKSRLLTAAHWIRLDEARVAAPMGPASKNAKAPEKISGASAIVSTMYNEPYLTPSFFFTSGSRSSAGGETSSASLEKT